MVATAIVPVAAANTDTAADTIYSDVSAENTHYENILEAKTLELLSGYTDGTFKPSAKLTRSNVVKALGKYVIAKSGKEIQDYDVTGVTPFNDVTANHPDKELYNYSLIVKKAGVFSGSGNNLLPTNLITRQQMAKVAVNAFGLKDLAGDLSKVTDNDKAFAEFRPYIDILSENGVTTEESFRPTENVARDQFASFLVRAYEIANPVAVAPEVVEVSAINAREITLEFNSALDEVSASNAANYALTVAGVSTAATVNFDAKSPKTVTLVLSDANKLTNNNAVQLVVSKNVLQDKTLVGMKEDFKKVWVFNDTVAPKLSKVEKSGDDVIVTFNEYVTTAEIIKVNGVSFTPPAAPATSVKTITITDGAKNLAAGTYEVLLSGVADITANKSSVLTGSFSVSNDTTAPAITKVNQTGDNELQITFDKSTTLVGTGNFTVKKGGYDLTVVAVASVDTKTYTLTLSDNGAVKVYDTGVDSTPVTLTATGIKSTANNAVANPYTSALTLSKDKTAPTVFTRFNTITDIDPTVASNEVFDIYFAEEVVLDAGFVNGDITLTDKDGIRQTVTGATVVDDANSDAKILRVSATSVQDAGVIKAGNYNINLSAGVVADNAGNGIAATNVAILKTTAAASVTATASATNNVITLSYGIPMSATATSAANYLLDGKALPAGTNIYFSGTTQSVKIELPAGTVKSTGGAVLSISDNVVSTTGAKLTTAAKTQNITSGFVDNVQPKLASAKKLTDTTLELTFDENIADASLATAGDDFIVKVNGVDFTYVATTGSINDNKIILTTNSAYNTAQTVTVSVTTTAADVSITDISTFNKLTTGTAVTAN